MEKDSRFVNRKVVRLQNFDYSSPNAYFITICTLNKSCIFGTTNHLSSLGNIAYQELTELPKHHPEVLLEKYVVMPNHIHAIIQLDSAVQQRLTIPQLIGLYKAAVSRRAGKAIWQRSFYEHTIRNQAEYDEIWTYIDNNPMKWELDRFYR